MPQRAGGQMVTPNMRRQKCAWEGPANAAGVIAKVKVPQPFDSHFHRVGGIPTAAYFT